MRLIILKFLKVNFLIFKRFVQQTDGACLQLFDEARKTTRNIWIN